MHLTDQTLLQLFPQLEAALRSEMIKSASLKEFKAGESLLKSGQYIRATMLILQGLVKVYREDEAGSEFLMYYLEPGHACALSILCEVKNEKSQILAKAVEDSSILLIPLQASESWMLNYRSWYHFVLSTYRQRFEELLQTLDSIAFNSLDERLVFYLKKHQNTQGKEVNLSHQQIAHELTTSREVISRLLKKLEQKGAIRLHRNFIEIIQLTNLL